MKKVKKKSEIILPFAGHTKKGFDTVPAIGEGAEDGDIEVLIEDEKDREGDGITKHCAASVIFVARTEKSQASIPNNDRCSRK